MGKHIETERANLFEPNVYITMVVKIEGTISAEELHRAVETAYTANEATMSRIVLDENGEAYYEKMERTGCKVYFDDRGWEEIVSESERIPFAIQDGELVRTFLRMNEGEAVILVHAHHLAGDGKSILILIEDIVNSLAGREIIYKPMLLINQDYLLQRASMPSWMKLALKIVNSKWKKTGKVFTWDDYYAVHNKYWQEYSSDIEVITYSVSELKKRCPDGVTLNSYLITELLKEYPESKVVGIPLSIREENESMSNQTSGIELKYHYRFNQSFEKNLFCVHKKIYKMLLNANLKYFVLMFMSQISPTLTDAVLLKTHGCYQNRLVGKMAGIMGYKGEGRRDLGVTNLMKIDIPGKYKLFQIKDILFIPPKVSYSKNVIGISTYEEQLHVSYHRMKKIKSNQT